MNRFILLLFCLSINQLFAQMINNESGQIFTETPFFNEKYLIIGASGFIGRNLCSYLIKINEIFEGFSRSEANQNLKIKIVNVVKGFEIIIQNQNSVICPLFE